MEKLWDPSGDTANEGRLAWMGFCKLGAWYIFLLLSTSGRSVSEEQVAEREPSHDIDGFTGLMV
jgi:hypothetical protein